MFYLNDRSSFLTTAWTLTAQAKCIVKNRPLSEELSFSEAIESACSTISQCLINDFSEKNGSALVSRIYKLLPEIRQYFKTGNCGQVNSQSASVNPTFLQPTTGKWELHRDACPFRSYLPLPSNADMAKTVKHRIITDYCKSELKKLVTAFRKRMDKIVFYFHPCDALVFCYGDLPYKFDIIDTSTLTDFFGLANLLNAANRKLLSDQSLLITESWSWSCVAPSVAQYVQEMLCCPLSLIPTLYGLRLMDKVELGQEEPRFSHTMIIAMPFRLRWKKAMPFDQVPLVLTPPLEMSLRRLMDACSVNPSSSSKFVFEAIRWYFSPLTFFYVLSDLIRRGSSTHLTSALTSSLLRTLRPLFRKSFETCRAWMENRPVWRVNVGTAAHHSQKKLLDDVTLNQLGCALLRFVLIPTKDFQRLSSSCSVQTSSVANLTNLDSTDNHLIDSFEFNLKMKSTGDWAEITFLIEDRSLLQSHSGIVVEAVQGLPIFLLGPFSKMQHSVELYTLPFPTAPSQFNESQLIGESCQETKDNYSIRFKILSDARSTPLSGIHFCFTKTNVSTNSIFYFLAQD